MEKKKPNPENVNPYDSKGYKRTNGYSTAPRPNPSTVNPYAPRPKTGSGK